MVEAYSFVGSHISNVIHPSTSTHENATVLIVVAWMIILHVAL